LLERRTPTKGKGEKSAAKGTAKRKGSFAVITAGPREKKKNYAPGFLSAAAKRKGEGG